MNTKKAKTSQERHTSRTTPWARIAPVCRDIIVPWLSLRDLGALGSCAKDLQDVPSSCTRSLTIVTTKERHLWKACVRGSFPRLQELELRWVFVREFQEQDVRDVQTLFRNSPQLTTLKYVVYAEAPVPGIYQAIADHCNRINTLELNYCTTWTRIQEEWINLFRRNTVHHLRLVQRISCDQGHLGWLAEVMQSFTTLQTLYLDARFHSVEEVATLFKALQGHSGLHVLTVRFFSVMGTESQMYMDAIKRCPNIRVYHELQHVYENARVVTIEKVHCFKRGRVVPYNFAEQDSQHPEESFKRLRFF